MAKILCNKCKKELDIINDFYIRGLRKPSGQFRNDAPSQDYDFIVICKECAGVQE